MRRCAPGQVPLLRYFQYSSGGPGPARRADRRNRRSVTFWRGPAPGASPASQDQIQDLGLSFAL